MLRTNAKITPLQAVLRYRNLLKVENLFVRTKAVMRTRPIFHSSDAAIRGHVFCSFLALTMQKYLEDLLCRAGVIPEWKTLLRDLDRRLGDGRPPDETRRQLHQLASWSSTFATKREISPSDGNSLGWSRSTACSISRAVLRPSQ